MVLDKKLGKHNLSKGIRPRRVAEQVRRVLSSAIASGRVPLLELEATDHGVSHTHKVAEGSGEKVQSGLGDIMVVVSHVVMSPDLKHAKVFLSFLLPTITQQPSAPDDLDEGIKRRLLKLYQDHAPAFQHLIAQELNLRFTPHLVFMEDDFPAKSNRTEALFLTDKVRQDIDKEGNT